MNSETQGPPTSLFPTMAVLIAVTLLVGMPLWVEGFAFNPLWGPLQALRRFGWAILVALAIRWVWHARVTGSWRLAPRHRLWTSAASLAGCIVTLGLLMPTYSWGKLCIPFFNSRVWDSQLYEIELSIHLGLDPSRFLLALVEGSSWVTTAIDWSYMQYGTLVGLSVAWLVTDPDLEIRHRFVRGFTMVWLCGLAGYLLFPVHGPIYVFPELVPTVAEHFPRNFTTQTLLLQNYKNLLAVLDGANLQIVPVYGIAALPSLHVAVPAFFLAFCSGYGMRLRFFFLAATTLLLFGSVVTGWHYAVDGYAGIAIAGLCWFAVRQRKTESTPARTALLVATLAALAPIISCAPSRNATLDPDPPRHVVVIVADTLRADRMSLYGHRRETTPFLREIEDELVVYLNAKSAAPWTIPSHASMFTGRHPAEHRAQWGHAVLADEFPTLAEVLTEAGFRTVGISCNPFVADGYGLTRGFSEYEVVRGEVDERSRIAIASVASALDAIRADDRRVFLFVNIMDTHLPYNAGVHGESFGLGGRPPVHDATTKWKISAGERTLSEAGIGAQRLAYDAAVRSVDDAIRAIHGMLRERNMLDDTVLVVTSDHGDGLGSHQEIGHSISVWEEQLSVPLTVRFPRGDGGGVRPAHATSLTSLMPSVLDWMGVPRPILLRSAATFGNPVGQHVTADYRSYFSDRHRKMNRDMATAYPELARRVGHRHVTYCGTGKLIVGPDGLRQLFDLERDPAEQNPLDPTVESHGGCIAEYERLLAAGRFTAFDRQLTAAERTEADASYDPETLRSLGYVQ